MVCTSHILVEVYRVEPLKDRGMYTMQLWTKTCIGIGAGIVTGFLFQEKACIFQPIGDVFLHLLKCLIVPLVFASIISGITAIPSGRQLGRIGVYSLFLYLFTTVFSIILGLTLSLSFPIGSLLSLEGFPKTAFQAPTHTLDVVSTLVSLFPSNPFQAFYEQNVLQIIVLALFVGIALNICKKSCSLMTQWMTDFSELMQTIARMIMAFSPIAVFALLASSIGSMGIQTLVPLVSFLLMYYGAVFLFFIFIHCGFLIGLARLKPNFFFKGTKETFVTAVSTCSSSACIPICIDNVTQLGVSRSLANFVLPLCSSLNMNGSVLYQIMATVFIAQASNHVLAFHDIILLVCTVFLASIGTAHIPGGGLIMLSLVFSVIGLPLESLALLAGIDRLRDMATTPLNILGDGLCTVIVAKREGELNEEKYYTQTDS